MIIIIIYLLSIYLSVYERPHAPNRSILKIIIPKNKKYFSNELFVSVTILI